jgi:symplekin
VNDEILQTARANLGDSLNPITRSIEAACRWTINEESAIAAATAQAQSRQETPQSTTGQFSAAAEAVAAAPIEEAVAQDPLKMELDEDDLEGRARDAAAREKQDKLDLAAAEAEVEATASGGASSSALVASANGSELVSTSTGTEMQLHQQAQQQRTVTPEPAQPLILPVKLKKKILHGAVGRICAVGISTTASVRASGGDQDLWIQLITRLVTRGLDGDLDGVERPEGGAAASIKAEKDSIRKQMFDFVTADIGNRWVLCFFYASQ